MDLNVIFYIQSSFITLVIQAKFVVFDTTAAVAEAQKC